MATKDERRAEWLRVTLLRNNLLAIPPGVALATTTPLDNELLDKVIAYLSDRKAELQ